MRLKKPLIVLLSLIGGMTLLMVGALVMFGIVGMLMKPRVPATTLLEVNLEAQLIETVPDDAFASFMLRDSPTVLGYVQALERAATDDRVAGLIAKVGAGGHGLAVTQELRDAIQTFRESGKFAIAYSETFGEVGPGNGGYYLATAFDEIWLQPSGDVGLTGILYEYPFIKGTLDKLGVTPQMDHRHEYKNAMNLFTETEFTEAHRAAMRSLMDSQFGQIVRGIAEGRDLPEEEVRGLVDRGPLLASEAEEAGLVDGLAYRDEVYDRAREQAGSGARFLYLDRYLERSRATRRASHTFALIYGIGTVTRGASGYDAMSGEITMGSDTVAGAIRSAVDDSSVDAIVFRVNSPGGSFVASDAIWRETRLARDAGKPVVITMGNVAASGGYFVAMGADGIVAQPGTITGSIGVLAGKMVTRDMWAKVGLTWDEVHSSRNATMWSGLRPYTPDEWSRLQAWLDRVYADFTGKVAEGRALPIERVQEIAKGRVWTGEEALEVGLIDAVGGFPAAIRLAKEAAGIDPDAPVRLKIFPARKTPLQHFLEETRESSDRRAAAEALRRSVRTLQPYVRQIRQIALGPTAYGPLSVPPPQESD